MKNKKHIIAIVIALFLVFVFLVSGPTRKKRIEWSKISEDYDIIADVSFDYYKKYINERNTHNGTIFLHISEGGESLTQTIYSPYEEEKVYYVNLTERQKTALKRISRYYDYYSQESIMVRSPEHLQISDDDAIGAFVIIKSKKKPTNWRGSHKIYNLGNDWWMVESMGR